MAFDMQKLKAVAKRLGGILVMNGDDPELVIMSYEQFESQKTEPSQTSEEVPVHQHETHADLIATQNSKQEEELIDALNKEILGLKEEIRQKEAAEISTETTEA